MIAPVTPQPSGSTGQGASAAEAARPRPQQTRQQERAEPVQPQSARVSLSTEAASQSRAAVVQPGGGTDLRYYDPADADKNGEVGELEQQAYDYRHPASLAEQQLEQQRRAELRAYAEVAAAGRPATAQS